MVASLKSSPIICVKEKRKKCVQQEHLVSQFNLYSKVTLKHTIFFTRILAGEEGGVENC